MRRALELMIILRSGRELVSYGAPSVELLAFAEKFR
jgi:hypothetical protein